MNFGSFFEDLTGYRISEVFILIAKTDLIEIVDGRIDGITADELLAALEWDHYFGLRFLEMLERLNLLDIKEGRYFTTEYSKKFFIKGSGENQSTSLLFEELLMQSWKTLEDVLKTGKRKFGTENKENDSYKKSLKTYISSMDDAAKIRAKELWNNFIPEKKGMILDAGAGSGAFICEFLERNIDWKGIFCDLNDVVDLAEKNSRVDKLTDRMSLLSVNLLDNPFTRICEKPDLILLSNLVHCYSEKELESVFENILNISNDNTRILIHDFFKDLSWHGALYDIHMMLNTYSGKTYSTIEMNNLLSGIGFSLVDVKKLPSHSAFMVYEKRALSL